MSAELAGSAIVVFDRGGRTVIDDIAHALRLRGALVAVVDPSSAPSITEALGGEPTAVILGDVPGLHTGAKDSLALAYLAPEVIVLGAHRSRLDETARTLLYQVPDAYPTVLALGRQRVPRVDDEEEWHVGPVAHALIEDGRAERVTLAGLDRVAIRRRRAGTDAMAGRTWRTSGAAKVNGVCLVGDADDSKPRVSVPLAGYEGMYEITGRSRHPDGIRVGTFVADVPYRAVGEVACRSGRLAIGTTRPRTFAVSAGSTWRVEVHGRTGRAGMRVRRLDADSEITQVRLRRGMCFGTCPVFELTLGRHGEASWVGEWWVWPLGRSSGLTPTALFGEIATAVVEEGFDDWPRELRAGYVTDVPAYELTVWRGRTAKRVVQDYPYEPPGFERIASAMEAAVRPLGWLSDQES